jgi:hypothetical protein
MKCKYHFEEYLDPDIESVKRFEGKGYCKKCDVFWSLNQPERSKREDSKDEIYDKGGFNLSIMIP